MDKTNILVLADHPEILETIIRLINKNESWNGVGVNSYENAVAAFEIAKFDLVLLGVGVDDEAEQQVVAFCKSVDSRIVCMRHYGGGSGLLHSEICHALGL
ncbi:response regulator receiver protein [Dyadobacter pollutisoli]|uniref:Response regulator receiver protein n=1 Tax=Dyadobacter pollutisoli TaxID=2910158 RepID=A0A9E8SR54_9BACT|nr:response regulator receiver protein [Dyadobacter pollutisoli]WAC13817.1 response regulator receiver protein [Dyadobacter pollutisoli]